MNWGCLDPGYFERHSATLRAVSLRACTVVVKCPLLFHAEVFHSWFCDSSVICWLIRWVRTSLEKISFSNKRQSPDIILRSVNLFTSRGIMIRSLKFTPCDLSLVCRLRGALVQSCVCYVYMLACSRVRVLWVGQMESPFGLTTAPRSFSSGPTSSAIGDLPQPLCWSHSDSMFSALLLEFRVFLPPLEFYGIHKPVSAQ